MRHLGNKTFIDKNLKPMPTCASIAGLCVFLAVSSLQAFAATKTECGIASRYELTSRTASGEMADPMSLSAAHRSLPFGTKVRVTNLKNGKSVVVRINDRGPFIKGRIIDVTRAAAIKLQFLQQGTAKVAVEPILTTGERGNTSLTGNLSRPCNS